jgi:hypothetical protein
MSPFVPIAPTGQVKVVIEERNAEKFKKLENSKKSEDKELYDSLIGEIAKLKINPYQADSIPKKLFPKIYKKSYGYSKR